MKILLQYLDVRDSLEIDRDSIDKNYLDTYLKEQTQSDNYKYLIYDKDFNEFVDIKDFSVIKNLSIVKGVQTINVLEVPILEQFMVPLEQNPNLPLPLPDETLRQDSFVYGACSFDIDKFKLKSRLELKKAEALYDKNKTRHSPSKKLKWEIMNIVESHLTKYSAYFEEDKVMDIIVSLVTTWKCLQCSDAKNGYWRTSIRDKLSEYRRANRDNPEVQFNIGGKKGSRTVKARKGEINFLPKYPMNETPESLKLQKDQLIVEWMKVDTNQALIDILMTSSFALRRSEVVKKCGKTICLKTLKEQWPALFTIPQLVSETFRVTRIPIEENMEKSLELFGPVIQQEMQHKEELDELPSIEYCLQNINTYIGDKLKIYHEEDSESALEQTSVYIYKRRDDFYDLKLGLDLDLITDIPTFTLALLSLVGMIYAADLEYDKRHKKTMLFIQQGLCKISGGANLKSMNIKIDRLVKKSIKAVNEGEA